MHFNPDDDSGPPPLFIPLPAGWMDAAREVASRAVQMVAAGLPRIVQEPDKLREVAMRNVRTAISRAVDGLDVATFLAVREAGYSVSAYADGITAHYERLVDDEVDRLVAEWTR